MDTFPFQFESNECKFQLFFSPLLLYSRRLLLLSLYIYGFGEVVVCVCAAATVKTTKLQNVVQHVDYQYYDNCGFGLDLLRLKIQAKRKYIKSNYLATVIL